MRKISVYRVKCNRHLYQINIKSFIPTIFFAITLFCYFFQFPFKGLSRFIVPSIFLFAITEWKNIKISNDKLYLILISIWYVFLGFECFNSIFHKNEINHIIRFLEILAFLPVCLFIKDENFKKEYNILLLFTLIKSLVLIGIAIYLIQLGNHQIIRNYVHSIDGGDIYLSGIRPKVQVHGNGLLPYIFILYNSNKINFNFVSLIIFLGILAAGNFAFVLAIGLFFIYRLIKINFNKKNKYLHITPLLLFVFMLLLPFIYKYIDNKREEKSGYSNAIRIEQAGFLTDTNYIIGKGLGNNVTGKGFFRTYHNTTYFELQTLYIFNQIGIIGLFLFYTVILFYIYKRKKNRLYIFLIYLFYTFWNPYCFDTTEMIAIIILLNMPIYEPYLKRKRRFPFMRYFRIYKNISGEKL